jgi:hypothetical protein
MIIKDFINQFQHCPLCSEPLKIHAEQREDKSNKHEFLVSQDNDCLTIHIKSSYFIRPDRNSFDFTISSNNGHIIYCDQTSQFISLYDLHIILTKECSRCAHEGRRTAFVRKIHLFYERSESKFTAEPVIEYFGFADDNNYYYFCNNFEAQRSFLSVQMLDSPMRRPPLDTPFIPFDKFDFNCREKLLAKMQSIQLLV